MKKTILSISLFTLAVGSAMFITSCSKDSTAPIISLVGNSSVTITLGDTYTDAGATATDDKDGTDQVTTSGTVDNTTEGSYTLTYSASDKAGNAATEVTRTVNVVINRNTYDGTFTLTSGNLTVAGTSVPETSFGTTISNSSTATDIIMSAFGGTQGANIHGTLSGTLLNGTESLHTVTLGAPQTFTTPSGYLVTITSGDATLNSTGKVLSLTWAGTTVVSGTTVSIGATESFSKN